MKVISAAKVENEVSKLFMRANFDINCDIQNKMLQFMRDEPMESAKKILRQIMDNYDIARLEKIAICQDCGMALVFAEIGQDVHIEGDFNAAIQKGVRMAYKKGYLRKSVVRDPLLDRTNTGDNSPAIVYTDIIPGDQLVLTAVSKGFGSENCSRIKMFVPSDFLEVIQDFIVNTAVEAGSKACPPVIVGVGIGGTMEKAALLAKKALIRDLNTCNKNLAYADMERQLLDRINASGVGPAGLGGRTTAIAVNIETFPTHIASIPVAVNLCCHASRHAKILM